MRKSSYKISVVVTLILQNGLSFFGSKSNSVVLVKSPMGSASAFPFFVFK